MLFGRAQWLIPTRLPILTADPWHQWHWLDIFSCLRTVLCKPLKTWLISSLWNTKFEVFSVQFCSVTLSSSPQLHGIHQDINTNVCIGMMPYTATSLGIDTDAYPGIWYWYQYYTNVTSVSKYQLSILVLASVHLLHVQLILVSGYQHAPYKYEWSPILGISTDTWYWWYWDLYLVNPKFLTCVCCFPSWCLLVW